MWKLYAELYPEFNRQVPEMYNKGVPKCSKNAPNFKTKGVDKAKKEVSKTEEKMAADIAAMYNARPDNKNVMHTAF